MSNSERMQEPKETLRGTLNLRIGGKLESEIDRIAATLGKSASETARILLGYGVEVQRRLEAQRLMQHYEREFSDDVAGRIEIRAEFVPYTWEEVGKINAEVFGDDGQEAPSRPPVWEDIGP